MNINGQALDFQELNKLIKNAGTADLTIDNCIGQRYLGCGRSGGKLMINGIPGNALGAYLNGADITVYGNAQDSVGDTMNEGSIIIHGSCGDTPGYAMRGGRIMIKGNAGYRAGIHMKSYRDKSPVLVIGGSAGSFLGEYQAGGRIIVLGLSGSGDCPVGYFCGTGMHGGKIFLRCSNLPTSLPDQVNARLADKKDLQEIEADIEQFCREFGFAKGGILEHPFYVLTPNTKNPYKQLYVHC
jgi:glutamate synthase domain-containing protein 3